MHIAHSSIPVWQTIIDAFERTEAVALLYVVESNGSSPGRQGFCMAVCANGQLSGSIGGGIMEHKLVEKARSKIHGFKIKTDDFTPELIQQIHQKKANTSQSGMICSGRQTILLFLPSNNELPAIKNLLNSLKQYKIGCISFSPNGFNFEDKPPEKETEFIYTSGTQWHYSQKTGLLHQLFLIGGGHCALALSQLMRQLDFYITVFDTRPQLNTLETNDAAHEKIELPNFKNLNNYLPEAKNVYVVIMSFGYRTDDEAIRSIKNRALKFLGVLGSQSKIDQLMQTYRSEGFNENWLQQIQAPVGLPINSQTPAEIAISIAAAIVKRRNSGTNDDQGADDDGS